MSATETDVLVQPPNVPLDPPSILVKPLPRVGHGAAQISQAVCAAMRRIGPIAKGGYNKDGKYEYVPASDVYHEVRGIMAEEGLWVAQRQVDRQIKDRILMVSYEYDLHHATGVVLVTAGSNTGSCRFEFKSGAVDDKSFGKAQTYGLKQYILGLFLIPTGDLADTDDDDDRPRDVRRIDRRGDDDDHRPPPSRPRAIEAGPPPSWSDESRTDEMPPEFPSEPPREPPVEPPPAASAVGNGHDAGDNLQARVKAFRRRVIDEAPTEDEAYDIWCNHRPLVLELAETTLEFMRMSYHQRWGLWPPNV